MQERFPLLLPITIVLAGLILGIAIFVIRFNEALPPVEGDVSLVRAVSPEDHTLGNPEAPVVVITYSDLECEYCQRFHQSIEQLMAEYGPDGQVLFVFRHFPLIELHPDAALHAEAAECAAAQGGDNAFFRFIDALYQATPEGGSFSPARYGELAEGLGLSVEALERCTEGNEFEARVASDFDNGIIIGVRGTPHTLVMAKGAPVVPVEGTVPYEAMKAVIDDALSKVGP